MILELHFGTYIRIFFGHCHVTIPYKEMLSFFSHCHMTFSYTETLSFFGRFVQKVIISRFSSFFFRKRRNNQKAAPRLQMILIFQTNYSKKTLFVSANASEKNFMSKEYCIALHGDKMCFLPNRSYHILLMGNIKELLQKLDAIRFNYQHVDCRCTLFQVPLQWQKCCQEWTTL